MIYTKNISNIAFFFLSSLMLFFNSQAANWKLELQRKIQSPFIPLWMKRQIQADLLPFAAGINQSIFSVQTIKYAHVSIIDNIIKIEWDERRRKNESKCNILLHALQIICSVTSMPNIKFVVDISDRRVGSMHGPIFCFRKDITDSSGILLPNIFDANIARNKKAINYLATTTTEQNIINFTPNNLRYSDMLYYIYLLLLQYSSLQNFTPSLLS